MNKTLFIILLLIFLADINIGTAQDDIYNRLSDGFKNPPAKARPKTYWWCLNGSIDTIRAKEELLAMKKAGLNGFDIFEIGVPESDTMIPVGPAFMSNESVMNLKSVINEAGKLGLTVGLNLASSWNAGGSWVKPEHAAKSLYYSKVSLKGVRGRIETFLPFPDVVFPGASLNGETGKPLVPFGSNGRPIYYEEVAVLALPAGTNRGVLDTSMVINLTPFFNTDSDMLKWDVPPGEWDIFRYVCSNSGQEMVLPSPRSAGLTINPFDSVALKIHLMYFIDKLLPVLGDFRNTALKSFYLTNYEAGEFSWTYSLPREFKKVNGYDVTKFIPLLFDKDLFSKLTTAMVKEDINRTLSELMNNNYYKKAKEISNKYGILINCDTGHPGYPMSSGPVQPMKALGTIDIPRGKFWVNNSGWYNDDDGIDSVDMFRLTKKVAAASHIYGLGIVEEASFASFRHWQDGPGDLKPFSDKAFCEGMNKVVLHGFSHNPRGTGFPGYVYNVGTHFNDKSVWWTMAKPFFDYLSRNSYIFQETKFVADVLWYYGDLDPNSTTPNNTRFKVGPGYDYEIINSDILVNDLTVKDRLLVLPDGSSFSILALGNEEVRSPEVEAALKRLSAAGAVITGTKSEEMLIYLTVKPDFTYRDDETNLLDYVHYRKEDIDFYFIRNSSDEWVSRNCTFRQIDKVPELWDPVTGEVLPVNIYNEVDGYINLPVTLAPFGSCFIVFRKSGSTQTFKNIKTDTQDPPYLQFLSDGVVVLNQGAFTHDNTPRSRNVISTSVRKLNGPWDVSFPVGWGVPQKLVMKDLTSWTKLSNIGFWYFSGIATYVNNFSFMFGKEPMNDKRIFLDLGSVSQVAEVWLNNKPLGITWTKPHRFDVTGIIIHGENNLKIKVANLWCNRIIGDAITGEKYTNTNIKHTTVPGTSSKFVPWALVPLVESGLLGPVTIETIKVMH